MGPGPRSCSCSLMGQTFSSAWSSRASVCKKDQQSIPNVPISGSPDVPRGTFRNHLIQMPDAKVDRPLFPQGITFRHGKSTQSRQQFVDFGSGLLVKLVERLSSCKDL